MEKLLDTISNSCEQLKAKGILTDDDFQKCKKISDNESLDVIRNEENKKYLNSVYEDKAGEISKHEKEIYNTFKRLYDSNLKSLIKAYNSDDKTLINRYNENLQKIKTDIQNKIKQYENNINNTQSYNIYKEMVLKNREMTDLLNQLGKSKNDILLVLQKKDNMKDKIYNKHLSLKNYLIVFIICLFITLFLIFEMKYKI